jgi:hypothetical protein
VSVHADRAVARTKPDDLSFDANNPTVALGAGPHQGIWIAAFAAGHISSVADTADPEIVTAIFTRNGHEGVQAP